ncbi:MAG: RDD family protein [Bacteroidetes bacterium]|nr:MAG: RDD family protein [Bacteroidota bacterium]
MKKITELTEVKWRTVYTKDAYGNRERDSEEYTAKRPVKSIAYGPRFGHFIIDLIAFQIVIYFTDYLLLMLVSLLSHNIHVLITLGLISRIVLLLLYPALYAFCEYKWQKTPGKFLTKTLVIDEYGNKPGLRTIVLRSLIRLVPFEPFSCLSDTYSRGWHDRWSNTWVVDEEELNMIRMLQAEQSEND